MVESEAVDKPMTDYLGNEIKDGMTIRIIRTKPMFGDIRYKNRVIYLKPPGKVPNYSSPAI